MTGLAASGAMSTKLPGVLTILTMGILAGWDLWGLITDNSVNSVRRSFLARRRLFSLCQKERILTHINMTHFLLLDTMGKALPVAFYISGSPPSLRLHIDLLPSLSTPVQPTLLCHLYPRRLRPHPPHPILSSLTPIPLHRGSTGTCLERHRLWIRHPAPI